MGDQTNEPLIAQLYSQYQVYTNILYGNVEIVQNVPIGHLIVVLSGDEAQRQQALAYLAKQGVRTNVLNLSANEEKAEFTGDLKKE